MAQSEKTPGALAKNPPAMSATAAEQARAPEMTKPATLNSVPVPVKPDGPRPFRYEVFRYSHTTCEPLAYGPVDQDYPIGPWDGLTLKGARSRILAVLALIYSGLRPAGPSSTASLGKLRSVQALLLGEVVKPGGYTVRSGSRMFNALYKDFATMMSVLASTTTVVYLIRMESK